MGAFFSRKKLSTTEVLEGLEKEIDDLESFRKDTELRQRRLIASILFYAFLVYFAGVVAGYFYVRPETTSEWTVLALPIVAFPSLVWLLKVALSAWYHRLLRSNDDSLLERRDKRRKILDNVKETETYKVAQEILERFDPTTKLEKAAKEREKEQKKVDEMVRRSVSPQVRQRKPHPTDPSPQGRPTPRPGAPNNGFTPRPPAPGGPRPTGPMTPAHMMGAPPPFTPRLPKPMLPRERSSVDKVVDYLLGDGPNNRYALICTQCRSHNGMCLREEFEFCAFRCAFCGFFNPARQIRPNAPRLPTPLQPPTLPVTTPEEGAESTPEPDATEVDEARTESSAEESAPRESVLTRLDVAQLHRSDGQACLLHVIREVDR